MNSCLDCPPKKKAKCKKLCKKMQKVLNEETKSFSFRWTKPNILEGTITDDFEFPNIMASKSYRAWIYELYFLDNKSYEEISFHLPLEKETIEDIVFQIKDGVNEVDNNNKKIILSEHLLKGSTILKTHKKTGFSKPYIYRVLREYIYYWNVNFS